jgi:hypothetical protein
LHRFGLKSDRSLTPVFLFFPPFLFADRGFF